MGPMPMASPAHRPPPNMLMIVGAVVGVLLLLSVGGVIGAKALFEPEPVSPSTVVATIDTDTIESQISDSLSAEYGSSVDVTCPSQQPLEEGYIFDCVADFGRGYEYYVRVAEDDAQGHYTWTLTDQLAS